MIASYKKREKDVGRAAIFIRLRLMRKMLSFIFQVADEVTIITILCVGEMLIFISRTSDTTEKWIVIPT